MYKDFYFRQSTKNQLFVKSTILLKKLNFSQKSKISPSTIKARGAPVPLWPVPTASPNTSLQSDLGGVSPPCAPPRQTGQLSVRGE